MQMKIASSGRIVANSEVTQFWSYFQVGGDPPGIRFSIATSMSDFSIIHILRSL